MTLANRADLITAYQTWLARTGDADVIAAAPDLISLAESRINYGHGEPGDPNYCPPLRVQQMLTRATASLTGEYLAVPTDYLEMRGPLKINTTPEALLDYISPQEFAALASAQGAGQSKVFTVAGNEFRLGPVPSSGTAELWYYAKVPALTTLNTTNWLLTAAPNVYLYGGLIEAAELFKIRETDLPTWLGFYSGATRALQRQDIRARYGSAPLVMRSNSPAP